MKGMLRAALFGTLLAGGLVSTACSPFGGASVFHCDTDSQCSPGGTCKQPEGLCTVPNATCAGGQEWGPHSGSMSGQCVGDEMMADAAIDAPTMCTPNAKSCFNHAVETCKATGDGFDPALKEPCALTCSETGGAACVGAATNIALADQQACNADGTALALSPAAGTTVTINQADITCAPQCNAGGTTTIPRTSATPNSFFCLAAINIPAGVTITVGAGVTSGVTLFSHGAVVINSDIHFDGGNATGVLNNTTNDDLAGLGGPGGGAGGGPSGDNNNGVAGSGTLTCGGRGGLTGGTAGARAGSGGGGGGNHSAGGTGGDGRTGVGATVTGGVAGTATNCSTPELRPLVGGNGGGGGGDGACGVGNPCGWPGGGGGALHLVSRSMISGSGLLSASGGNGFGEATEPGGGGGGGSGGAILLEAPMVNYTGNLAVNGGNGGLSNAAAAGGTGATGGTPTGGDGGDANANDQGGAGAGGASGRIRINADNASAASCATASPTASCTTGALRTAP